MLSLRPRESFVITRVLADHTDSATYYVRAVVRKASDGVSIETVNLTDQGNRIFSKTWGAPGDRFAQIIITTTVYTDGGYSVKSENYREETSHYIIEDRPGYYPQYGGSGGGKTDYERLRKIVREEIQKIVFPDAVIDFSSVLNAILMLETKTASHIDTSAGIIRDAFPKLDLTPALRHIEQKTKEVHERIARIPPTDLSPIMSRLDQALKIITIFEDAEGIEMFIKNIKEIRGVITQELADAKRVFGEIEKKIDSKSFIHMVSSGSESKKKTSRFSL